MRIASAVAAILVVTLFLAVSAWAQVPEKMSYQVMLTNDVDEPLPDQAVEIFFRIYNSDVGGSLYWSETHNTVTNSIGVVSVTLGETTPLPHDQFDQALWLDIEVDSEALAPRRELVASPFALFSKDSERLAGNQVSEFVLDSELATGGAINTPSNPVDWTKLKNVPAGFADGTDDTGGVGDGHSLDADDGAPVDALYIDASGDVGIGGLGTDGVVELYADGGATPQVELLAIGTYGGHIQLYEDGGERHLYLEPDYAGTGGFLRVADGNHSPAFEVEGNADPSGDSRVTINAQGSAAIFEGWQTGNDAVQLPVNAVSSPEVLDEPGVSNTSATTGHSLTFGAFETLLSESIYCPSDGYVLALATVETHVEHTSGIDSDGYFGVSNTDLEFPEGAGPRTRVSAVASTGSYTEVVTTQWVFQADEGVETIYLLGHVYDGNWSVDDRNLSLVFFPTYYGRVASGETLAQPNTAAGRAATEAGYNARVEAELAAMEARIAEIRANMGNSR